MGGGIGGGFGVLLGRFVRKGIVGHSGGKVGGTQWSVLHFRRPRTWILLQNFIAVFVAIPSVNLFLKSVARIYLF